MVMGWTSGRTWIFLLELHLYIVRSTTGPLS